MGILDLDLEQSVIGGFLMLGDDRPDGWAAAVEPQHFLPGNHRTIAEAINELLLSSSTVDVITVNDKLTGWGHSLAASLHEIEASVPSSANLQHHSRRLIEKAQIRSMRDSLKRISGDADRVPFATTRERLQAALGEMDAPVSAGGLVCVKDLVPTVMQKLISEHKGEIGPASKTGILEVDTLLRMQAGDLTVLAARPSMGKSALANNILRNAAASPCNGAAALFSLEVSAESTIKRWLAAEARKDSWKLPLYAFNGAITDAANSFYSLDLWIDDRPNLTVDQMRSTLRRLGKIQLVAVDYLGLARMGSEETQHLRVGAITKALKALAKEFSCHVLALHQLNRSCEKRSPPIPMLSDLRDSGNIEEDADNILFLYRPGYYDRTNDADADLLIAKQRNGPTGAVRLRWFREYQLFVGLETGAYV